MGKAVLVNGSLDCTLPGPLRSEAQSASPEVVVRLPWCVSLLSPQASTTGLNGREDVRLDALPAHHIDILQTNCICRAPFLPCCSCLCVARG